MSKSLLGNTIDMHMGGVEHISVHHTNEIAQSEAANGARFVNYWLHNEHLNVDDAKMAKSEGTSYTLADIKAKGFSAMDLRYFFLQAHYRSKQNFTWEALSASREGLKKLKNTVLDLNNTSLTPPQEENLSQMTMFKNKFQEYISNDFQIPQVLALVWSVHKSDIDDASKLRLILDFDKVLGLKLNEFREDVIPKEIKDLAEKRKRFKIARDFKTADELRRRIEEKGYAVEDLPGGYRIRDLMVKMSVLFIP